MVGTESGSIELSVLLLMRRGGKIVKAGAGKGGTCFRKVLDR